MDRKDIMNMSINDCIKLLEKKDAEIEKLKRKVETLGKKCNKYEKKLTALHFGGEENIPKKDKNHNKDSNRTFAGSDFYCGFYALIEDGQFVIGEERGREGGVLYRGEYKGDDTPYMYNIKRENIKLYNSIVKYFSN
jgi:hypothetical protein